MLDYAHLVVSTRPGWQPDYPAEVAELLARHQSRQVADLHRLRHGRIWLADNLPVELSATRLRALLATGADPAICCRRRWHNISASRGCTGKHEPDRGRRLSGTDRAL